MKKVFILTQFGTPHKWTQKFIDHVQHLGQYGWYWQIYTSNDLKPKGNVEIIPMKIEEFNHLVKKHCGIDPQVEIVNGLPSKPMSDYYVASGLIFQDYIKDFDFWGITNWDVMYGRLDHFITDKMLEECDIWSDDVATINGVFSLYRNNKEVNHLFKHIPNWQEAFMSDKIIGTDEYGMTEVAQRVRFSYPKYYPLLSHDRLENHVPLPKLSIKEDGSLWELLGDTNSPHWKHARFFIGREIPYFHFSRTKSWPSILL
jgi:hypothetical protein